ncbi:MAG: MCE family protein [Phycisphaerales bacterium]|nr:MCE family protein [Phycisphaerales bacterium]
MMSEKARNTVVGLTFAAGIILFILGISYLGRLPALGPDGPYSVTVKASNADGLTYGDLVDISGVVVGTVQSVSLRKNLDGADIILSIYRWVNIPDNATASIGSKTIGTPYLSLLVPTPAKQSYLSKDGTATLTATVKSGGLIPQSVIADFSRISSQFDRLSIKLDLVATDLHSLLKPVTLTTAQANGKNSTQSDMNNISALIQRLNATVSSVNSLLEDKTLRSQVRIIVANIATSSEELKSVLTSIHHAAKRASAVIKSAGTTASDIDATTKQLEARVVAVGVQLTTLLEHVDAISVSVLKGHGTVGRLVKDPRLYDALLDVSQKLKSTVDDLHALIKQVQANGVHVNF